MDGQKSQESGQETTTYSEEETVSNKQHTLISVTIKKEIHTHTSTQCGPIFHMSL